MARGNRGQVHIPATFSGAATGLLAYRTLFAGPLQTLRIRLGAAPAGGSAIFTVYKNGVSFFSATVTAGTSDYTNTFSGQSVADGDLWQVDLTSTPSVIGGPVTIELIAQETGAVETDSSLHDRTLDTGVYEEFAEQSADPSTPASGFLRLYVKTDHSLYTRNSAGTVTQVGAGGGGGSARPYPFTVPTSPDSHDDEFDSSTIDPKWTNTTTAGATYDANVTMPSAIILKANGNYSVQLTQTFTPGTADFSITSCHYAVFDTNNQNHLIALQETGGNNIIRWVTFCNGSTPSHYCDINSGFSTSLSPLAIGWSPYVGTFFMHLQRLSNVYELYWSTNGISWRKVHNVTLSTTVGKMWLFFGQNGVTTKARHGMDFVRFNWQFLP